MAYFVYCILGLITLPAIGLFVFGCIRGLGKPTEQNEFIRWHDGKCP